MFHPFGELRQGDDYYTENETTLTQAPEFGGWSRILANFSTASTFNSALFCRRYRPALYPGSTGKASRWETWMARVR